MPLGDSLTWGYDGGPDNPTYLNSLDTGGYRSPLYLALGAQGVNVNFVGSSNGNPSPVLTAAGQTAQDGYTIQDISNNLAASVPGGDGVSNSGGYWLTSVQQPNIIILQAGANDIEAGYDPLFTGTPGTESAATFAQDTATRLGNLISQILSYDPNTWIFTDGTPTLLNNGFVTEASGDYWEDVQAMIATRFKGQNVVYVDMSDAIRNNGFFGDYEGDGVHFNTAGYAVMGDAFADSIMANYNFADVNSVPEPSTWVLLLGGVVALAGWRKLRLRKS
jgi:lysophospholipase L1-like esterase